jgi:hypothetical protein
MLGPWYFSRSLRYSPRRTSTVSGVALLVQAVRRRLELGEHGLAVERGQDVADALVTR